MSFRPPFPNANNIFPYFSSSSNLENINNLPQSNAGDFQRSIRNNFPNCHFVNSSNVNRYPLSTPISLSTSTNVNVSNPVYNNASLPRPPINAPPLPDPNPSLINTSRHNSINFVQQPSNVNQSFHLFHDQSYDRNVVPPVIANSNNANLNFELKRIPIQCPPPPIPNIACTTLPPNINYPRFQNNPCFNNPGNVPISLPQFPVTTSQSTANILSSPTTYSFGNVSNSTQQPVIYTSPVTVIPTIINSVQDSSANLQNNPTMQMPLQLPVNDTSKSQNLNIPLNTVIQAKETKLVAFLAKFTAKKKENKNPFTIPEFRYVVKTAIHMIKLLNESKNKLSKLLDASESEWKSEAESTVNGKKELSTLLSFINAPDHLKNIIEKLRLIKKRRERKKKTKQNMLSEKLRAEQKRKERDQEIDKWLDDIKEKNQKMKREAELKKEADYILLEVRRKIYEAKKTIEKIKVFEKLRNARESNATKKGLHVLSMHNLKFEKKMTVLKDTMIKQLADYEAEEKALKVMLETEQEGQREEEAQWKIKKMKALQKKRQNHIMECLFGISDEPLPTDPLYLFHKYHTSATSSIENLIQIRSKWDSHIAEDGEVVPQHWVLPVAPSNSSWEQCLESSKT